MSRTLRWAALLVALSSSASAQEASVPAEEDAAQLLSKMATAVHFLDYEGSFVYVQGSSIEAMRIAHTEHDGYEREQLVTLSGSPHQIVRDNYTTTRVQPESNQYAVVEQRDQRVGAGPLPSAFSPDRVARSYDFRLIGEGRHAGRVTRLVALSPRDEMRYGYRLHLDAKYALPLKFDVVRPDGELVSQLMFTDIRIRHETPESIQASTSNNEELKPAPRDPYAGPWRFSTLPPGFDLEFFESQETEAGDKLDHFVFFDGMASISIYIDAEEGPGLQGLKRVGTLNLLGGRVAGRQITILGEIPAKTLELILSGIRREQGAAE